MFELPLSCDIAWMRMETAGKSEELHIRPIGRNLGRDCGRGSVSLQTQSNVMSAQLGVRR